MENKMKPLSRVFLVLAALLLAGSLFVPIWRIDLDAPQYPEGLRLQIWADKIGGDVDVINGLNHYIGMKTLHTEDFIEFSILTYIIIAYAFLFIVAALAGRRRWLYFTLIMFIIFGIVAMADFWKWEYDYGHNLDPNAAIKVPGMSYQPPLIGFKQLLNFGAYSIPDTGGWMIVAAGMLLLFAVVSEKYRLYAGRKKQLPVTILIFSGLFALSSCSSSGPEPIRLHKDACYFCKMSISDGRFGAELVTKKGKVYKFDDLECMQNYAASPDAAEAKAWYIADFNEENKLIAAAGAWYVSHESIRGPMGGQTAAFATEEAARLLADSLQAPVSRWEQLSGKTGQSSHDDHSH